jgi:hypothetical protein
MKVTMITGPAGGRSGIGDYTEGLIGEISEINIEEIIFTMKCNNPLVALSSSARLMNYCLRAPLTANL